MVDEPKTIDEMVDRTFQAIETMLHKQFNCMVTHWSDDDVENQRCAICYIDGLSNGTRVECEMEIKINLNNIDKSEVRNEDGDKS